MFLMLLLVVNIPLICHSKEQVMEQITVTATRSSRNLLTLDRNISLLDDKTVEQVGAQHINQLISRVPGGWISRGNGQEHLTAIRSPVLTGAGGCGAFFIAQDGISLRGLGFCNVNQLFDANTEQAARVELVRGPASTLYGSNAVHGVLNILTPDPFEMSTTKLSLTLGPHDYSQGMYSVVKAYDEHALLAYGNLTRDGGYKDESGFKQQKTNFIHQYNADKWQIKNVIAFTNLNQESAGFIKGFEAYKDPTLKQHNPNPEAFRDNQSFRTYSLINYRLDAQTLYSISPYIRWAKMKFLQHYLPWQPIEENAQRSIGIKAQIQKHYDDISLLTGFDVDYTQGQLIETQLEKFSPSIPVGQHYNYDVTAELLSSFAALTWQAFAKIKLTAGLRYELTTYDYENNLSNGSACKENVANCRFSRPASTIIDFGEWSYQLGGNYTLSENKTVYVNYSTGFRAPQATELFRLQAKQKSADLNPEEIYAIELGLRGQTLGGVYELSTYAMKKEHFIFLDTNRRSVNNGETSHQGIEFSLLYHWENYYASVNGTFAKHEYGANLTLSKINIKGNEVDTAPEHMGSMQLGWRDPMENFIELEWVHQGNYYLNPENTAGYQGHNLLNFRAGMKIYDQFFVKLHLYNLTNEDYAERADFGFGRFRYFVGEPRAAYLGLEYSY